MQFLYFLLLIAAPVLSLPRQSRGKQSHGVQSRSLPSPRVVKHGMFTGSANKKGNQFEKSSQFGRRAPINPADPLKRRQASSCASGNQLTTTAPKANIFAGLTNDEAAAVTSFLHSQSSLNLTAAATAAAWDNELMIVELLQPNKSDALSYYDANGTAPVRYARAVIQFGATLEPYIQEYQVGPLPVNNGTTAVTPLTSIYTDGKGYSRVYDQDAAAIQAFTYGVSANITDITQLLINGTAVGALNDTIELAGSEPLTFEGDRVYQWNQFFTINTTPCLDEYLLLSGLQFKTDITGRDPTQYAVVAWQYNGIFYESLDTFRQAMNSSSFVMPGPQVDGDWACTDYNNEPFPHDELNPPVPVTPDGSRFAIDEEQGYVEWMDFSFYISSTRDRGIQLNNIAWSNERFIYEVGLQEAVAHYASSSDPFQASNAYLDSFYGFGLSTFELVSGFDCPAYATYINTTFYVDETTHTHPNSICIFEFDPGYPIQRHTAPTYVSVTKNIALIVRSVATVGNYDYMFDYEFYQDGSVRVTVRASGYIQSSYWVTSNPTQDGFHIHDHLLGSMHDHVLNYKLDLDIAGTANSLAHNALVPVSQVYPWSNGVARNTMTFNRSFITSEDEGKINWDINNQDMYAVVNTDAPNAYGEYRGYRFFPATGHRNYLTIENSSSLGPSVNWATNHFYALQRHDTEPHSAYPFNLNDPFNPVVDFNDFFNGESLDQEDVVIYFNLGMHHVPNTADLPNTVFTTAESSMIIAPQNFNLGDPSRSTIHQTRINVVNGSVTNALTFGATQPSCSVDLSVTAPNLQSFIGEVFISKYPYEPDAQEVGNLGAGTGATSA